MRYILENCLLLLHLFIISSTIAERKYQIICADKSLHCKRRSHLCQSNAFRSVMQSLCKKTCNLCEERKMENVEDENVSDRDVEDNDDGDDDDDDDENDEETESVDYRESQSTIHQIEEEAEEITEEPMIALSTIVPYDPLKGIKYICMDTSSDCEGILI
ncbi:unnamed protein product [Litomosoides sigmodontis]|uniref:ShKT domain-containing protein n=1 Tax=Litomosoides sigmodontis TaxID=42156 RepID=A0A3P7JMU3_LITSI|nr:unnamed protein product [Litomosoides sigmodontis]